MRSNAKGTNILTFPPPFPYDRLACEGGEALNFTTATTVFLAPFTCIPVFTTHTVVGAVMGVGMARGIESCERRCSEKHRRIMVGNGSLHSRRECLRSRGVEVNV